MLREISFGRTVPRRKLFFPVRFGSRGPRTSSLFMASDFTWDDLSSQCHVPEITFNILQGRIRMCALWADTWVYPYGLIGTGVSNMVTRGLFMLRCIRVRT